MINSHSGASVFDWMNKLRGRERRQPLCSFPPLPLCSGLEGLGKRVYLRPRARACPEPSSAVEGGQQVLGDQHSLAAAAPSPHLRKAVVLSKMEGGAGPWLLPEGLGQRPGDTRAQRVLEQLSVEHRWGAHPRSPLIGI